MRLGGHFLALQVLIPIMMMCSIFIFVVNNNDHLGGLDLLDFAGIFGSMFRILVICVLFATISVNLIIIPWLTILI
jgi:hypothetical protein